MAGNGALDLSIRIMGKVDPSLVTAIKQTKGLTGDLASALTGTKSLGSTVANTLGVIGKTGLGIMATLTTASAVMIKKTTSMAEEYQAQAADAVKYVGGIMNDDGSIDPEKRATMEDAILKMTTQVPIKRDEMAQIAASLGQSGKSYEQIFLDNQQTGEKSYLYDTARLAAAWDIDAKSAADYMAKWETAFGKTHNQIIDIADSINYLGGHMATTAAEIASVVNTSGGVGQTAGVDLHTTSALAATMLAMGVNDGKAGTSLNRVFTNITLGNSATDAQTGAWNRLGFDPVQIAKDMQSTGPNGEDGAASTLYKVFEAISKQDKYQQTATIKTLFGQWAIEGVSKIVGNLPAFQNALLMAGDTSAYSGSMEKELLVRLDTSKAVSQMASNATDRLLINVGNQFLPAKKELTAMWIDIANGITESLPDLSNIVNGILPMLHSALLGIGNAAQAALPWIQKGIDYTAEHGPEVAGAIAAIVSAFGAMSFAPAAYSAGSTLLSTVGNVVIGGKPSGAPGGMFGGITVRNLLGMLSPTSLFQNTVRGGWGLWSNRGNILKSAKMGAWMANGSGQGGIAGRLSSLAGGAIGALNSDALTSGKKKPMQAVAGKIFGAAGYINNVANIPTNAMNAMIAAANPAGTATATIGNVLGAGVGAVFGKNGLNLTGGIGAVAGKLGGGFMSMLGMFGPAITSLGTMVAVVSLLGDHFEDVRNIVGTVFGEGGLAVFDKFTGKIAGIGDTVKQVFGQLTTPEGLQSIQEKLSGFSIGGLNLGDVFGAMTPAIQTVMPLIESFAGVFSQIVDLGVNHIKPVLTEIFGFIVNEGIPAVMPLLSTVVSLVGTTLVNAIKVAVDLVGKVLPVVEPVILGIIGFLKQVATIGVKAVNFIIGALNKIQLTIPETLFGIPVPVIGGKSFGFNLSPVSVPAFANGGMTQGPSIAGEAGPEAVISFRRGVREKNIDTWLTAGKLLGVGLGDLLGLPGRKPKMFADGGFTEEDSNLIDFNRARRQQYYNQAAQSFDTMVQPVAAALVLGSDAGVAFSRITEIANYAVDGLETLAAMPTPTVSDDQGKAQQLLNTGIGKVIAGAKSVLANENTQKAIRFIRGADAEKAKLEYAANPDNYDLSNVNFFPTAGNSELTRQNLSMLADLQNYQQEVELKPIGGSEDASGGSTGNQRGGLSNSYQRTYTSSSGNTYVYAPNFTIYGSMNAEDLRSIMDEGYEKFCEYVERYEREKRRTQYGT
ncbi:phage tail tape measure protein [Faecalibacterium prausnitzii]|uniref:phage tail tape measure protein n=1 Tax=Faecalibacterium prausnitzii TaxID=853 RepID=UPI001CBA8B07|nr:phage tail tape measure protein [Faecalibacterium prausnitzii]